MRSKEALDALFELTVRLGDAMQRGLNDRGLTVAKATVLWHVLHQGPLTQRQISDALQVSPRYVTDLVDSLQAAGFVERAPHPTDRRATLVRLTEAGADFAGSRNDEYEALAESLFGETGDDEVRRFAETLTAVLGRLRELDFDELRDRVAKARVASARAAAAGPATASARR